jgi:dolichol-phosphate mannosyltransferase
MSTNQLHSLLPVPSGSLQIPASAFTPPGSDSLEPPIGVKRTPQAFSPSHSPFDTRNMIPIGLGNSPILLSMVIPTYNESRNIQLLVYRLSQLLDEVIPGAYELIVVDDNSPDRTWEIAAQMMADYPQLRVMRRTQERGLSTAVVRGWQVARGEVLGVIDADLQHPPELLLKLWGEIVRGGDLAVASRNVEGGGVQSDGFYRVVLRRWG